jgi:hypothetical protein
MSCRVSYPAAHRSVPRAASSSHWGGAPGERPAEDEAEVAGLPYRGVLDQSQEVGPGSGQRAAGVVVRQLVELSGERLADLAQVIVKMFFDEITGHSDQHGTAISGSRSARCAVSACAGEGF